jgi:Carboxypeptidase regulatory-like domain
MKIPRASLAAGVLFVVFASGVAPIGTLLPNSQLVGGLLPEAQAQNLGQRVVMGSVVDADSGLVAGATVFLRNTKTKSIRSYTSSKDGRFRFAQVNMSEDFDLWAEKEGRKSPVKTVSSWDARKEFETELKIK